ncbi:hypothetical protein CXB77_15070 [Chromatium okenii]|uniref:Uncharacterized protein n=1 Tax=Chromatium okenii TaxID=61644 RepID=A0A2S7XP30_9GAMM|nr:hypothetical protein CXB77_15070 [Chromatium okenii]
MILGLTFALQFFLVAQTFPLSELFGSASLLYIDNPFHEYNVAMGAAVGSVGYDPFFAAGRATGFALNHSDRLPAFLANILPSSLTAADIWKLYTFAVSLIASICLPLTLIILRFERNAIAISAALGLLLWWTGIFRWFHTAGMVSFIFIAFASLPFTALVVRLLTQAFTKTLIATVALGLVAAFLFFSHPLFPLPITVFLIFYLALNRQAVHWQFGLTALLAVAAIGILLNVGWLYYFMNPLEIQETFDLYQRATGGDLVIKSLLGIWDKANGARINTPIALAVILGFFLAYFSSQRRLLLTYSGVGVFWLLYAYTAGDNDVLGKLTQPNRFTTVAYLFLALPAAVSIAEIFCNALQHEKTWRRAISRASAGLLAIGLTISVVEMGREVSSANIGHYGQHPPQARHQGEYADHILSFLNTNTDNSARVLFETSLGRIHDGGHIAGILALKSQREFVGGPYVQTGFASFWDGKAFTKPIAEISPEKMHEYFDRYNIGWIIAHSEKSKRYFDQLNGVVCINEWKQLKFYQVQRLHSFFLAGAGELVARDANRLVFKAVLGDSITLKYHYLPGMQVTEGTIDPVFIGDDPNPFIQLRGASQNVILTYR